MTAKQPRNEILVKATEAQNRILGKRFCSSCQNMRMLEGGEMVGDKVRRWKCSVCLNRAALRKYQSVVKKQED